MSDRIEVGDLVELRGSCCSYVAARVGMYGVVENTHHNPMSARCPACGYEYSGIPVAQVPDLTSGPTPITGWFPASWLRKVPGFPELADEKIDDRIPELVMK